MKKLKLSEETTGGSSQLNLKATNSMGVKWFKDTNHKEKVEKRKACLVAK